MRQLGGGVLGALLLRLTGVSHALLFQPLLFELRRLPASRLIHSGGLHALLFRLPLLGQTLLGQTLGFSLGMVLGALLIVKCQLLAARVFGRSFDFEALRIGGAVLRQPFSFGFRIGHGERLGRGLCLGLQLGLRLLLGLATCLLGRCQHVRPALLGCPQLSIECQPAFPFGRLRQGLRHRRARARVATRITAGITASIAVVVFRT